MDDVKKVFSVRVKPRVSRAIRVLAARNDLLPGDVLGCLVRFQESAKYLPKEDRERFTRLWDLTVTNARLKKAGWAEPKDPNDITIQVPAE